MKRAFLIAALCAGLGGSLPDPGRAFRPLPPKPDRGPLAVACPRCGAGIGAPCNRRTLGRHPYHLARVETP